MDNLSDPISQDSLRLTNVPAEQSSTRKRNANLLLPVLVTFLITALVFGLGGYYFGTISGQSLATKTSGPVTSLSSTDPSPTPTITAESVASSVENLVTFANDKYGYVTSYISNEKLSLVSCGAIGDDKVAGKERLILYDATIQSPDDDPLYECITQGENHLITLDASNTKDPCVSTESWKATERMVVVGGVNSTQCSNFFVGERLYPGPDEMTVTSIPLNNQYIHINLYGTEFASTYDQLLDNFEFTR